MAYNMLSLTNITAFDESLRQHFIHEKTRMKVFSVSKDVFSRKREDALYRNSKKEGKKGKFNKKNVISKTN